MPQIIAGLYEITEKIGSGGGGVVYLGRHLRLNKQIVLKADKRTLATKQESLRREVDALKDLTHTYIPQVYDYIEEDGVAYTVMDYIEGESLDRPLKRGERFPQATVIEWACQLLEALDYLHSRPPHGILHSDIKPANIMLTPKGDIRLIDFNIALALGAEGAVRVGFSRGYASPEHYHAEQTPIPAPQKTSSLSLTNMETIAEGQPSQKPIGASTEAKRGLLLDVRSDIYSLGATLYHLFSGVRPAQEAEHVADLTAEAVSPAVAAILKKAMAPDPAMRYQTAAEMLYAFEHLHENDPRTKAHKRRATTAAAILAAVFLLGGALTFTGLKQMQHAEEVARIAAEAAQRQEQAEKEALAAVDASESALMQGDVSAALEQALLALKEDTVYVPRAQMALTSALGIYDLADGFRSHLLIDLPGEPLKIAISPDGTRTAAIVSGTVLIFDTESGEQLAALEAEPSALSDVVFRTENEIIYAGAGALTAYDLSQNQVLWSGRAATGITLSADGSTVAAVYKDENLAAVYDAASGKVKRVVTFSEKQQSVLTNDIFADLNKSLFVLNEDGSLLAVSFGNGALQIYDLSGGMRDIGVFDESDFKSFAGGFSGEYFSFSATGEDQSVFVAINTKKQTQTGGFADTTPFRAAADENGVYLSCENLLVRIDPETGEQRELAYTSKDISAYAVTEHHAAVITADGAISVFDENAKLLTTFEASDRCDFIELAGAYIAAAGRDTASIRIMKQKNNEDSHVLTYASDYKHNEARVSADGATVMLFRYDSFRLYRADGTILTDVKIPDAGQVYDQQFRRDETGSRLEVIYYSGLVRSYSAEDGSLLSEEQKEPPDDTLYEKFLTDAWRITSTLHGAPAVYDRESGEQLGTLREDAYLTYVTQVGEYVVTEYITTEGERYGILLDSSLSELAILPDLCDVLPDGRLIFDDMSGTLRESRIYSLRELIALAEN